MDQANAQSIGSLMARMAKTAADAQTMVEAHSTNAAIATHALHLAATEHYPELVPAVEPVLYCVDTVALEMTMAITEQKSKTMGIKAEFLGLPLNLFYEKSVGSSRSVKTRLKMTVEMSSPSVKPSRSTASNADSSS